MVSTLRITTQIMLGCVCLAITSGCAMRNAHYKSFLDLRDETAGNYSQQVIDAIVGVVDEGQLPVFFTVEGGQSTWAPSLSGSLSAIMAPPWNSSRTQLNNTVSGSESMSSAIQFNDFGSAPMSRVNTLYAILCFQYDIGTTTLPNGVLYTVVSRQDSPSGLLYARKTKDGYIGVPEEKREEFLKFAKDVNFWTRHAVPDLNDLNSSAGLVYRLSIDFPSIIVELADALSTRDAAKAGLPAAQQALAAEKQAYDDLVAEAKSGKGSPEVMNTLLQYKREELQSKMQGLGALSSQAETAEATISNNMEKIEVLMGDLRETLVKVKAYDPEAADIDIERTLQELNGQVASVIQGDSDLVKKFKASTFGGALDAQDSVDKLYRDRFESLPERYEGAFQSVD